jgi:hypothetical protein
VVLIILVQYYFGWIHHFQQVTGATYGTNNQHAGDKFLPIGGETTTRQHSNVLMDFNPFATQLH